MVVADVMTKNPVTVSVREPLSSAFHTMRTQRVSLLPVLDGGKVVGLLTARDACWDLPDLGNDEVGAEMDSRPVCVRPDANLRSAASMLLTPERLGLLVVDRGHLVGVVTPRDLLRGSLETLNSVRPPVTTLVTVPQGGGLALTEISTLIRARGDLLATMREPVEGPEATYRLRISTRDPDAVISLLEARGHRVRTTSTNALESATPTADGR